MACKWHFPLTDGGHIRGVSTGDAELFKKTPYALFGREILQNSIDVAYNDEEPVRVEFKETTMKVSDIPGIEEYKAQVKRCAKYFETIPADYEYCERILNVLNQDEIKVLRISDFNTKGLRGIEKSDITDNNFLALTKGTGVSVKNGTLSAGSKGVGKNATINLSSLTMVFYSTYTCDGYKGSLGVTELITGFADEEAAKNRTTKITQGSGYYQDEDNELGYSKNLVNIEKSFTKRETEYGTDIFIIGFDGEEGWEKEVINSALDSFMASFVRGKLEMTINGIVISRSKLEDIVYSDIIEDKNKPLIVSQYKLLMGGDKVSVYDIDTDLGSATLFVMPMINEDEQYATHCCTMIRYPLMRIKNYDFGKNIPASAICIIGDNKLGKTLLSIENPQHKDWEPRRLKNKAAEKDIKLILNQIYDEINQKVLECLNLDQNDPIDPFGADEFLPEDLSGGNGLNKGNEQKYKSEKTTFSKKKKVVSPTKPGLIESQDETDVGLMPDIGGIDDSVDGNVMHPTGHNDTQGGQSHAGAEQGGEKDGESEIFKRSKLKVVKFYLICVNKKFGLYKVNFIPLESQEKCYLKIALLDDSGSPVELPIESASINGVDLVKDSKGLFGTFSVTANVKTSIDIKINTYKNFGSGVSVLW